MKSSSKTTRTAKSAAPARTAARPGKPAPEPEKTQARQEKTDLKQDKPAAKADTKREATGVVAARDRQKDAFEAAVRHFHTRDFRAARKMFVEATEGPNREMAHSARLHIRMCEQRIAAETPELRTPDDRYHFAVALINQQRLDDARGHLAEALRQAPDRDYINYAMSLCLGLLGDLEGSRQHLERAIQLDARNRAAVRNDPDFQELLRHPELREVALAGRKG